MHVFRHGVYSRFDTIPECDRQTDRQTNILRQHSLRYMHSIARYWVIYYGSVRYMASDDKRLSDSNRIKRAISHNFTSQFRRRSLVIYVRTLSEVALFYFNWHTSLSPWALLRQCTRSSDVASRHRSIPTERCSGGCHAFRCFYQLCDVLMRVTKFLGMSGRIYTQFQWCRAYSSRLNFERVMIESDAFMDPALCAAAAHKNSFCFHTSS